MFSDHTSLPGHHHDRCASGVASSHDRGHVLRAEPVEKGGNILYLTSTNKHLRKAKTGIENGRLFRNQALKMSPPRVTRSLFINV